MRTGKIDGYLLLPPGMLSGSLAEFHTRNPGDFTLATALGNAATQAAIGGRLARDNVHISNLDHLLARVKMEVVKVNSEGETQEKGQTFQAAVLLAVILYTSLLLYGINTMRSIQEEKSTRIMEILLSSVRPFPLLAGKILGVGAEALTRWLPLDPPVALAVAANNVRTRITAVGRSAVGVPDAGIPAAAPQRVADATAPHPTPAANSNALRAPPAGNSEVIDPVLQFRAGPNGRTGFAHRRNPTEYP